MIKKNKNKNRKKYWRGFVRDPTCGNRLDIQNIIFSTEGDFVVCMDFRTSSNYFRILH